MMVRLPIAAVVTSDGRRSYWVAAVPPDNATDAVAQVVRHVRVIKLLEHRLRVKPDVLRPGEVRQLSF
ncbi:hypothetical protein FXB38_02770 [Bradyrhizobium cytisi]|uniref:Transposase n=1 Tax=Bradyrhizobium cytisi TaxID=515489 RepID=A0A5S4X404_9BRAD|nr:hypothetical protein FXB38_02770 [Bradyrhizobium cytisi]